MVVDKLGAKYTDEKIKEALKKWEYAKDRDPPLFSITSRLAKYESSTSDISSSIIVHKIYSLLPSLNIINHYYLVIDGKVWHPGYVDEAEIYLEHDTEKNSIISCIEEKCHYCVYHMMKKNFLKDRSFNIITNNCQRITGHATETALALLYHICIVGGIISGSLLFLIGVILSFCMIILYNVHGMQQKSFYIEHCPHIRKL